MKLLSWASALCATATLLSAPAVSAFCRATTCDPSSPKQKCELDAAKQCVVTGKPLGWRSSCVTVGVHKLGSPANGFSYDEVASVVEQAFGAWQQASCKGGPPSIEIQLLGQVECGESEYNGDASNANIVLFREGPWPYIGAQNAIGLTTTRFDTNTGDLWDADIELNGADSNLSIGDPIAGDDLLSVLTHEAGHFLGLSHSFDTTATMKPVYDSGSDAASFRSLAPDDVDGICTIYPPGRKVSTTSCENRHGFSEDCADEQPARSESKGCSLTSSPSSSASDSGLFALLAVCGARLARRRRIV